MQIDVSIPKSPSDFRRRATPLGGLSKNLSSEGEASVCHLQNGEKEKNAIGSLGKLGAMSMWVPSGSDMWGTRRWKQREVGAE